MSNSSFDEIRRLKTAYYSVRADKVLTQFRNNGLYPLLNAPELRNNTTDVLLGDATVAAGTLLKLTLPNATANTSSLGDIYFTTDGSDPRTAYDLTGSPRAAATLYSVPFAVSGPMVVKARALAKPANFPQKANVRAASPGANVAGTYNSTGGLSERGQITAAPPTLDGITLAAGDRILLKNQSPTAANGIWLVTNAAAITIGGTTVTTISFSTISFSPRSALMEFTILTGPSAATVSITEFNYNPRSSQGGSAAEFIEFLNYGTLPVKMTNWSMDGVDYIFPAGFVLQPGNRIVIASSENPARFALQYPGVTPLRYFGGSLNNFGERLSLLDGRQNIVCSVEFKDVSPWPTSPDNGGYALEVIDPAGDLQSSANWRASIALGGSPGTAGAAPAAPMLYNSQLETGKTTG